MKIQVTQKHIEKGERTNCQHCPVALAVQQVTNAEQVSVDSVGILITTQDWTFKLYDIPPKVRRFMIDFDRGFKVQPFEFELPIEEAA